MIIYSRKNLPVGYYVYAYIRSKDSKSAKAGTPYYIGKGSSTRAWDNSHTVKLPRKATNIIIMEANLTEIGAFALERRYIHWWGRIDNHTGILRNRTDGGEGMSSEDARKHALNRVAAKNHNFQKRADGSSLQTDRVLAGSHPFQKREDGTSIASERVEKGTHPFIGGEVSSRYQRKLVAEEKHHLQQSGPAHPKYDHTMYELQNIQTLEIVSGNRQYLINKLHLNYDKLSKLIRKNLRTTCGWRLVER